MDGVPNDVLVSHVALTMSADESPCRSLSGLEESPLRWTDEDVSFWLNSKGFEEYCTTFTNQKVNGKILLLLKDEDLFTSLCMESELHRRRLLLEIVQLGEKSCEEATTPTAASDQICTALLGLDLKTEIREIHKKLDALSFLVVQKLTVRWENSFGFRLGKI